jgi:adenylosuccinate synthase
MKKVYIIVDLCYGDAGKGTIVDFLSRQSKESLIVRYNGGAQAAHNVVTADGKHHTFSQFGSGTLFPTTKTFLSKYMLVNPLSLMVENEHLKTIGCDDALKRLYIDPDALVTTPFQVAANRIKEAIYGEHLSGSCGMGIWETVSDYEKFDEPLRIHDLFWDTVLTNKLQHIQEVKRIETSNLIKDKVFKDPEIKYQIDVLENPRAVTETQKAMTRFYWGLGHFDNRLEELIQYSSQVIFEGAQGVLLDVKYGFAPYTTWTNITTENAIDLIPISLKDKLDVETIGIFRTYFHRHGAGPFVTEDKHLDLPELHNDNNRWQKSFKVGYFDLVAARYALQCAGKVDSLAITHLDYLPALKREVCFEYHYIGDSQDLLQKYFEISPNGNLITNIIPQHNTEDREQQARMLFDMRPCVGWVPREIDYIDFLSASLKLPVSITSSGMTAEDKKFIIKH